MGRCNCRFLRWITTPFRELLGLVGFVVASSSEINKLRWWIVTVARGTERFCRFSVTLALSVSNNRQRQPATLSASQDWIRYPSLTPFVPRIRLKDCRLLLLTNQP